MKDIEHNFLCVLEKGSSSDSAVRISNISPLPYACSSRTISPSDPPSRPPPRLEPCTNPAYWTARTGSYCNQPAPPQLRPPAQVRSPAPPAPPPPNTSVGPSSGVVVRRSSNATESLGPCSARPGVGGGRFLRVRWGPRARGAKVEVREESALWLFGGWLPGRRLFLFSITSLTGATKLGNEDRF